MTVTELNEGAKQSAQKEIEASIWQSVKACKTGLFWCFVVSLCVIMEGYDLNLLGNFFAFPRFAQKYGHYVDQESGYQLTPAWQAASTTVPVSALSSAPCSTVFSSPASVTAVCSSAHSSRSRASSSSPSSQSPS